MSKQLFRARHAVAAALVAVTVPATAADPLDGQHQRTTGSVRYVTGGVGVGESTAMLAERSRYPLAVEVYARDGGHEVYTAGAEVVVRDRSGDYVLAATADGPFLFADVAPGRYVVEVTVEGRTRQRQVVVPDSGTARAVFVFDAT